MALLPGLLPEIGLLSDGLMSRYIHYVAMNEDTNQISKTMTGSGYKGFLPGLRILSEYQSKDLGPDVLAGLVICLVLIPSALAYAELAGFGPLAGIHIVNESDVVSF